MGCRLQGTWLLVSVVFVAATAYEPLRQGNCPGFFLSFTGGRCLHISTRYIYFTTNNLGLKPPTYKWTEARKECLDKTTGDWTVDLAFSLDADVMMQFTKYIINEIPEMSRLVFHVGAERDTPSGLWEWMDGQLVDPYSYVWNIDMPNNRSDTNIKGKLVPSGAYNRFYMVGIPPDGYAPSFICEAARKC